MDTHNSSGRVGGDGELLVTVVVLEQQIYKKQTKTNYKIHQKASILYGPKKIPPPLQIPIRNSIKDRVRERERVPLAFLPISV